MSKVLCSYCEKEVERSLGRINESKKEGWKTYCSPICQSKSKNIQTTCVCSNPKCGVTFKRQRNQYIKSKLHFCSLRCACIINNKRFPKKVAVIKKCAFCGKSFKGNLKYCSSVCRYRDPIVTKKQIIIFIKNFVSKNNRIPFKKEYRHYNATRNRYGTWNYAVEAAGFEPNPVMFANKHIAKDGHKCDSLSEKIIDDWFYSKNIEHEINVKYPGKNGFTADFKVGNWWVEFFGLEGGFKKYDVVKNRKLKIAKKFNLKLIDLHPGELFPKSNIEKKLIFLIK